MDPIDIETVNACRVVLIRDMELAPVIDHLMASRALLEHHENEIMIKPNSAERNRVFLKILKTIEAFSYDRYIEALRATQQNQLVDLLVKTKAQLQSDCRETNAAKDVPPTVSVAQGRRMDEACAESSIYEDEHLTIENKFKHNLFSNWITMPIRMRNIRSYLRKCYKTQFRRVRPFSLPFTFDIANTWVSLALKTENGKQRTEDHCSILKHLFTNEDKMVIIEGRAASGKTSLMRRYAYDWANDSRWIFHFSGKMRQFDLVLIAEFRDVQNRKFKTIAGLALASMERIMSAAEHHLLKQQLSDYNFCKNYQVLILLDGFDEASSADQCEELQDFLTNASHRNSLQYHVILSTRPGYTSHYNAQRQRVEVVGFDTTEQKTSYIRAHFSNEGDAEQKIALVLNLLAENENINKLVETPLLLTFICLLYKNIQSGSLFEIYSAIIWYLLDRYQKSFPSDDLPKLFGFNSLNNVSDLQTIQDHYTKFPVLTRLGKMAFEMLDTVEFSDSDLEKYEIPAIVVSVGLLRREERRDASLRLETFFVFPHRTIQEFFAGGLFYFWPEIEPFISESSKLTVMNQMFRKTFNISAEKEESLLSLQMNELEKFIWRIAVRFDLKIENQFEPFFRRYDETLSVDVSIFRTEISNACLTACKNATCLVIYSSETSRKIFEEKINMSQMQSLETICFFRDRFPSSFDCFFLLDFPQKEVNRVKHIAFIACHMRKYFFVNIIETILSKNSSNIALELIDTTIRVFFDKKNVHFNSCKINCKEIERLFFEEKESQFLRDSYFDYVLEKLQKYEKSQIKNDKKN